MFKWFAAGAVVGATAASADRVQRAKPADATPGPSSKPLPVPSSPTALVQHQHEGPGSMVPGSNPGPIVDLLKRQAYVTAYDRRMKHPAWTAEHLTAENLIRSESGGTRDKSIFQEDEAVPEMFRARLSDYFRSGYDRGHMVPAADAKRSQFAMNETFLLSNIAPQVGEFFNRHYWAYLEDFCRKLTIPFANVFVFTVPLYLPKKDPDGKWRVTYEVIGPAPNVAVPTHFAKVILGAKYGLPGTRGTETSIGAFVLPNAPIPDETPLTSFIVPVEAVERAAGLTLFNETLKITSKELCKTVNCAVTVRRFDDAVKGKKQAALPPPTKVRP